MVRIGSIHQTPYTYLLFKFSNQKRDDKCFNSFFSLNIIFFLTNQLLLFLAIFVKCVLSFYNSAPEVLRVKNKVIDTALKHAKQYMDKYNNTFSAEKVNSYYLIVNTLQVERQI